MDALRYFRDPAGTAVVLNLPEGASLPGFVEITADEYEATKPAGLGGPCEEC